MEIELSKTQIVISKEDSALPRVFKPVFVFKELQCSNHSVGYNNLSAVHKASAWHSIPFWKKKTYAGQVCFEAR